MKRKLNCYSPDDHAWSDWWHEARRHKVLVIPLVRGPDGELVRKAPWVIRGREYLPIEYYLAYPEHFPPSKPPWWEKRTDRGDRVYRPMYPILYVVPRTITLNPGPATEATEVAHLETLA